MIKQLLTMEGKAPFTLHDPYLADYSKKFLNVYRRARHPPPQYSHDDELVARDAYDQALIYMAIARGYFLGLCLLFVFNFQRNAYRTFSRVQTLYRYGSDDDRSGTFARIGLGSRS